MVANQVIVGIMYLPPKRAMFNLKLERWKEVFLSVSKNGRRSNFTGLTEGEVKMDQRGIDSGAYYTHMKTKEGGLLWTKNASDGTILSGGLNKNYHKEMLGGGGGAGQTKK